MLVLHVYNSVIGPRVPFAPPVQVIGPPVAPGARAPPPSPAVSLSQAIPSCSQCLASRGAHCIINLGTPSCLRCIDRDLRCSFGSYPVVSFS